VIAAARGTWHGGAARVSAGAADRLGNAKTGPICVAGRGEVGTDVAGWLFGGDSLVSSVCKAIITH
jgi:hypothetical protein